METSHSFLEQLCRQSDSELWERLVETYALMRGWIDRYGVQHSDADDLIQDVLLVVMRELPSFRHNRHQGAFRSWLRRIVVNRLRNFWRARDRGGVAGSGDSDISRKLDELEDGRSQLSQQWDREHDRHLTRRLLELIEPQFTDTTRQAFRRLVLDGQDADTVAAELGMSLNAVFTAKSRVLRELRAVGRGLLD